MECRLLPGSRRTVRCCRECCFCRNPSRDSVNFECSRYNIKGLKSGPGGVGCNIFPADCGLDSYYPNLKQLQGVYCEDGLECRVTVVDDLSTPDIESYHLRVDAILKESSLFKSPTIGYIRKVWRKRGPHIAGLWKLDLSYPGGWPC